MGISSPGIGSGLVDVNGIISKLMAVEAAPLTLLDKKVAAFNQKLSALGKLSGSVGAFQNSLSGLTSLSSFQSNSAISNNTDVMVGTATSAAIAGAYKIDVTQMAQAQTLSSGGRTSSTAAIGLGGSTTLSFQLGTTSGGSFGMAGGALGAGVASGGIASGALSINGIAIATDSSTTSAKALAAAINDKFSTTGVSATAQPTVTSATLFSTYGNVDTGAGAGTYKLSVGGVDLGSGDLTAGALDTTLGAANATTNALAAAGITFTGTAAAGTLKFSAANGANIAVTETVTGTVTGGLGKAVGVSNSGSSLTATSTIQLASTGGSPITIAGNSPTTAGLTAGSGGNYLGASFTQNASQISGTVVIDSTNNSLQGIRDAINKANVGVTATIVSDGSANPFHLVLTSSKTGEASSMKIDVSGTGGGAADASVASLLGYDPAGVQNLSQSSAAQSTKLSVNGVAVTSETATVADAIQGVTLTMGTVGKASLTVSQDTTQIKGGVASFVKAYNDLSSSIKDVSGYDPQTKKGGPLLGDSTVQNLQSQLRKQLTLGVTGLKGDYTALSQIGISFQKDGSLLLDTAKLDKAIKSNFNDVAALFAAVGKASDSLVAFKTSTAATKPGDYALNVTTLASQGAVQSDAALAPSTVIAPNTSWTVSLNQTDPTEPGRTATFSLAAGSYTPAQLATLFQSAINGAGSFADKDLAVNATVGADGKLSIASAKYGSVSKISLSSTTGTTYTDIFGAAAPVDGTDVAGTLGGQPATGSGQFLTGKAGTDTDGMKVEITGGLTGARGTVGFSQGYAYQLNNMASTFLGAKGLLSGRTEGIGNTIKDISAQKDAMNLRLDQIEKRYRAQYTALDVSMGSMSTTSTFLQQQLSAMAGQLGR